MIVRRFFTTLADRAATGLQRETTAEPLAALRIGTALVLLVQAASLAPHLLELYGERGLVQWPIVQALTPPGAPRIAWVVQSLAPLGVSPEACVRGVFLLYLGALSALLLGWRTRGAALTALLGHIMLCISGGASVYGVDTFARIALFYCVLFPAGHAMSLDRVAGRAGQKPLFAAHLGRRMLQFHLCLIYLGAGIPKALSPQWWSGDAIWYSMMQPTLAQFDFAWLAEQSWVALFAAWSTILIEVGYSILIWPRWTRVPWATATIGLHLGIAVLMGLGTFGAMMIVLNVAAFLVPETSVAATSGPWKAPVHPSPMKSTQHLATATDR